jgi:D-arabinose 1-dehydrogenase-like Zn-dependent alcohol dehydrogenase
MAKEMGLAAVFTGAGKDLEIRSYPLMAPAEGSARLELVRSGICGTDIHIADGRLAVPAPVIPGHEFLGRIDSMGEGEASDGLGQKLHTGDMALACVAQPCGTCFSCTRGNTASCLNFGVTYVRNPEEAPHFFGGYAEALFSPLSNLVRVPDGLDADAVAAFPCAGPTVIRACEYGRFPQGGELVVVQGTGAVGLFAIALAASAGSTVVAIGSGSNEARLRLARRMGAEHVLDYRATSAEERAEMIKSLAHDMGRGDGADLVVEASGSPSAFAEGLQYTRTLGTYLVPGQYSASGGIEIQPQMVTFKALNIVGSGQYTLADVHAYLRFLQEHPQMQSAFADIITHRYTVAEANKAISNARQGLSVKGVFVTC